MQEPMHAYLFTNGSSKDRVQVIEKRLKNLGVSDTDRVYLRDEGEYIGIDAVRSFRKQLILKPYQSPVVAGIILGAQRLTVEAQNALLKILEEPPPHVLLFIETPSAELLLTTIVSRLTPVSFEMSAAISEPDEQCRKTISDLLSSSPGKKISIIDTIATDRVRTKEWVQLAIATGRLLLLRETENPTNSGKTNVLVRLVRKLLTAQQELDLNINPKHVLDAVFLSL